MCAVFHLPSSPIRRLTVLYIVALSLVAVLSIAGQILIQTALHLAPNDTHLISFASKQQMLSQKLSKDALAIEVATITSDTASQQHYTVELRATLAQWQHVHKGLRASDTAFGVSSKNSTKVTQLFSALEPHYLAIFNASSSLLACINAPTPPSHVMIATSVHSILVEEPIYLTLMNTIVLQYQHESEDRIAKLRIVETVLLTIMLVVLACEGFFVFRPAVKKIRWALAEQSEAKQHIEISYEEQRQLNNLKDQMLLNVNHELRTLMTSVYGYLELLHDHGKQLDATTEELFFVNAIQGCEEFQVHVNTVLNVLKVGNNARPLTIETLNVAQVVTTVLDLFDPEKKHKFTIQHDIPDSLLVLADRQSLYQILRNLLSNAFKYSPTGTRITVSASLDEHEQTGTPHIHIAVKDEGHGISAADIHLLFNKFVRLQRDLNSTVDGSGLGLYISKQLVEAMHGSIWVESTGVDGEGSCFFIALPVAEPVVQTQNDNVPSMPVGV